MLTVALTLLGSLVALTTPASAAETGVRPTAAAHRATLDPLLDVVVRRLQTGDIVAAAKWPTRGPIEDPAREQVVLDTAEAGAASRGLDEDTVVAVFGDQIAASKTVQYGLFAHWTAVPEDAPTTVPDLSQIRPVLDRITEQLLDQLAATTSIRSGPACAVVVRAAAGRAARRARFDQLHRSALSRAVASLCD